MKTELYKKDQSLPRYTSYPTAPHFHDGIKAEDYRHWLNSLNSKDTISLYIHIPFCDTLCWFCGCHTKITQRYDPISKYLSALHLEIALIASEINNRTPVTNIHFGGGSPTILSAGDFHKTTDILRKNFNLSENIDFAIEIDPRGLSDEQISSLATSGVNRVSIGVQDFNKKVQKAINREQTFQETSHVISELRNNAINAVNIDLLYGLPYQTLDSLKQTIEQVLSLTPDRISFFGYAHVPWMKKHQNLIEESALPDLEERIRQADYCSSLLLEAGYIKIGFDHFAHPDDSMAQAMQNATLKRNFQGYTTDTATAIIGLGASSIGKLPQGYIQNKPAIGQYQTDVANKQIPVARGLKLTEDDKLRAHIIETLMCTLRFSENEIRKVYGDIADTVIDEARTLVKLDNHNFTRLTSDGFTVTEAGRPYIRIICAHFDKYLTQNKARHSLAV